MKLHCCLLFTFFIANTLYSQHCNILDSTLFFKSIQFGKQVPALLTGCQENIKLEYPNYSYYRLQYDSLDKLCRQRYADLFKFQSVLFSFVQFNANKKGQVYEIQLYSFFTDNRPDSRLYSPPPNFTGMYNKLVVLYGKPTGTTAATTQDSLFIKSFGMPRQVYWDCNNIRLSLRVNYGAEKKELNVISIQIKDKRFELIEQEKLLQ